MPVEHHQECPNCDDSQLDIRILDEKVIEEVKLHSRDCQWVCLNCGWLSEKWTVTN